MKSKVTYVQGLYAAILDDIGSMYPTLRVDVELDKVRLFSLSETRGLSFFTIDLVDLGKHFDKCLAEGLFVSSGLPGSRAFKRTSTIPRLFKGMYLRVFTEFGVLRNDADIHCIRFLRQLYYAAKKLRMECENERTWKQVREFYSIDRGLRSPSLNWAGTELDTSSVDCLHLGENPTCYIDPPSLIPRECEELSSVDVQYLQSVQTVCDIVSSTLGRFDPLLWRTKHGPGAVSDQPRDSSKYEFPCWPDKLEHVFPMADFAFANYAQWADYVVSECASGGRFSRHEPPSRLIAVPKTQKGPRLIAAEPVAHQWCQQVIKDFLTDRLDATPIRRSVHFRDQSYNQEAARRASRARSGWTIDLSNASDRLSVWVVERAFRRNQSLLSALHATRTRWISNEIDRHSPRFSLIRKFATAGSAVTFPVQSIVFCCIAIGVLLHQRNVKPTIKSIQKAAREVLVFGDDIIVPDDVGVPMQGILDHLGFKVNTQKTFGIGRFRESCGLECFDGTCVTPTYSLSSPERARPESIISWVSVRNNFYRSGYFGVATWMESQLRKEVPYLRIPYVSLDSGSFGMESFGEHRNVRIRTRVNRFTQQKESLVHSLSAIVRKRPDRYSSMLLQYFTEAPSPTDKWTAGIPSRPKLNLKLRWEPSQHHLAA